jgi:hypothetical protein
MPLKQIRKSSNSNKVNRKGKSLTKKHNGGAVYTFDLAGDPIGGQAARLPLNGTRDGDCPSANLSDLALGNYAGGRRRSGKSKSRFARVKNSFNKYMKKIVKTVKRSYKGKKSRKGSKRRNQMGGKGGEGKSLITRFMHHRKIEGKNAHNARHKKEANEKQQKYDKDHMWDLDKKNIKILDEEEVRDCTIHPDSMEAGTKHTYTYGKTLTPYMFPDIKRDPSIIYEKNKVYKASEKYYDQKSENIFGLWTADGFEEKTDTSITCPQ